MPRLGFRHRAAALVVAAVAGVVVAGPAFADATLVASTPADGATLGTAPPAVTFTFDEFVQARLATVTVTDAGGAAVAVDKAFTDRATVIQPLPAGLAAGQYTTTYRIVSADGHAVTGRVRFTIGSAPLGTEPAAAPAPQGTGPDEVVPADPVAARQPVDGRGAGARAWPWVAGTAAVLLGLTAAAVLRRRRPA